ncbi:hypothetical protein ACFX15_040114 [Malus domestica]
MFCSKFNINLCFASPAHPLSNGQVEAINKIIKRTLKTSLDKAKEAVVLVKLEQATFRVQNYVQSENDKQLTLNLDLVEEHRNQAHLKNVAYKQRISNYYDSRVKPRSFKVGDCRPGSYKLRSSDGKTLGHPWNADHLKYFYK